MSAGLELLVRALNCRDVRYPLALCLQANCNKRKNVGLRSEDIDLLAEDLADLLDQGGF